MSNSLLYIIIFSSVFFSLALVFLHFYYRHKVYKRSGLDGFSWLSRYQNKFELEALAKAKEEADAKALQSDKGGTKNVPLVGADLDDELSNSLPL